MRDRRNEMPAELVELDEPIVEMGDRVAGGGAAVGIDEDDAVVAVVRVGLRGECQPVTVLLVTETPLASPAKTMMPLALPAGPPLPISVMVL